jgi:hypothetical protein
MKHRTRLLLMVCISFILSPRSRTLGSLPALGLLPTRVSLRRRCAAIIFCQGACNYYSLPARWLSGMNLDLT